MSHFLAFLAKRPGLIVADGQFEDVAEGHPSLPSLRRPLALLRLSGHGAAGEVVATDHAEAGARLERQRWQRR